MSSKTKLSLTELNVITSKIVQDVFARYDKLKEEFYRSDKFKELHKKAMNSEIVKSAIELQAIYEEIDKLEKRRDKLRRDCPVRFNNIRQQDGHFKYEIQLDEYIKSNNTPVNITMPQDLHGSIYQAVVLENLSGDVSRMIEALIQRFSPKV